jgi:hypothetical protein
MYIELFEIKFDLGQETEIIVIFPPVLVFGVPVLGVRTVEFVM